MFKLKRICAFSVILALLLSMAACGTSDQVDSPASEAQPETPAADTQPAEVEASAQPEAPDEAVPDIAGSGAGGADAADTEEVLNVFPLFEKLTTYTIWVGNSPDLSELIKSYNDFLIIDEMEKLTNLHWDATLIPNTALNERFSLMVVSQDYADVVNEGSSLYTVGADQAIEDEFLIDISPYIEENMPNFEAWIDEYPELKLAMTTMNGNVAGFPKMNAISTLNSVTSGACIRLDWLEELGLSAPKTFDEMYDVLMSFKTEKDVEVSLYITNPYGTQEIILNGYNLTRTYYQVDGEVRFGLIQPEFEEYLTMLNRWYRDGLINVDFISGNFMDVLMDASTILNGETGIWYGSSVQPMPNLVAQAAEPMEIGGLTTVTKDGSSAHVGEQASLYGMVAWCITTACEDPAPIAKYVDYLYGDEGFMLANYGVEGYTFNYDEDGIPRLTEVVTNNPNLSYTLALNVYTCDRQTQVPFVMDQTKAYQEYNDMQKQAVAAWAENSDYLYNLPNGALSMTSEETSELAIIFSDIETYIQENVPKFIIGDRPLSEYDDYIAEINRMNIDRCIELSQIAYDRFLNG